MADPPHDAPLSTLPDNSVQDVPGSMEKVSLQTKATGHNSLQDPTPRTPRTLRRLVVYTRPQLLALYQSPLVKALNDMPALKEWFGDWTEQTGKSHSDISTAASTTRDRRFRRDQEDGEPPPRATFRSTLSQPSQMGNFKHQSSLRTSDRDRDKDGDKDRERDSRDRDGERLRNLSDKYDRERLAAPAAAGLRSKDRDSAPHLSSGTSRLGSQNGLGSAPGRRGDGREALRRKPGESNEDWRRGRDDRDRHEGQRRDRDDRERPRSRVRDSSRSRRDTSPPRRDREDRDRDRDRDRDDNRKRDDPSRRDRDVDRDNDDDPRRWRDDGKREERMAARRELRDRDRERPGRNGHDSAWDTDRPRDRDRWNNTDERDGRSKRANGRDRRAGSGDEVKDREERRERDKEREKEKEPAWMDTYVPTTSGGGILGGKTADGEVDSIQAWKKSMKEKEEKERAAEASQTTSNDRPAVEESPEKPVSVAESQMDEIQLFKMMIKREEEKKKKAGDTSADVSAGTTPLIASSSGGVSQSPGISSNLPMNAGPITGPPVSKNVTTRPAGISSRTFLQHLDDPAPVSRPFVSSAEALISSTHPYVPPAASSSPAIDSAHSAGSRFFPAPLETTSVHAPLSEKATGVVKAPIPAQYDPPSGSRLLALGSRTSSATLGAVSSPALEDRALGFSLANPPADVQTPMSFSDVSRLGSTEHLYSQTKNSQMPGPRAQTNYPSFENQLRPPITLDDEGYQDISRRQSLASIEDRHFGLPSDPYSDTNGGHVLGQSNYPPNSHSPSLESSLPERSQGGSPYQSKGSRFAKYFDAKGRDVQAMPIGRTPGPPGFTSPSPLSLQRQERSGANESAGPDFENRTMEDIFAMLQSSAQGHRGHSNNQQGHLQHNNNGPPYQPTHAPLHTVHQHQHNAPQRNVDVLYDNRLDDRNFVPDGMVPGLRSVPPPRARDHVPAMFQEPLDDMAFNVQPRLAQQRGMDPLYPGPPPSMFPQGRNVPIQQQFRNGPSPSPNQNQNAMHGIGQQRGLPPGLANLGGRPPHEPSQFVNNNLGISPGGLQSGAGQSPFNNFPGGNGVGFGGGPPQMRGPPPGSHSVAGVLGNVGTGGLHGNKVDIRAVNQAQLLGLGMGGMRVPSGGFGPQQGVPNAQIHAQQLAMRQQQQQQQLQQQQLPSHVLPRMLPPHLQAGPGPTGQPAQDLMALLMHGAPRE